MNEALIAPLWRSIAVGLLAVGFSSPLAVWLGYWLARSRSRLKPLVSLIVFLPLVLPPVVTGWLLLWLLGQRGLIGRPLAMIGLSVPFSFGAAVIAAMVVGFPLFVMSVRTAFASIDRRCEEISLSCGLTPMQTLWQVSIPLAAPGLMAGSVLAFARALGEFGATIVLAGNTEQTRTIAVAVYTRLDNPSDVSILPLVLASIAISAVSLLLFEQLMRWQRQHLEIDGD